MKKILLIAAVLFLLLPAAAIAGQVRCAYHPNASCYGTGQIRNLSGRPYEKYHCSCGDDVWVAQ